MLSPSLTVLGQVTLTLLSSLSLYVNGDMNRPYSTDCREHSPGARVHTVKFHINVRRRHSSVNGRPPFQGTVAFQTLDPKGILNTTGHAGGWGDAMCVRRLSGKSAQGQKEEQDWEGPSPPSGGCISTSGASCLTGFQQAHP